MFSNSQKELKKPNKVSTKAVSERARLAVQYIVDNGGVSKGEALRAAGYSESIALNPDRVFNSEAVKALMTEAGVNPVTLVRRIKKKAYQRQYRAIEMPKHKDDVPERNADGSENTQEHSTLRDGDIIAIFEDIGWRVLNIEHRREIRVIWCSFDNTGVQAEAERKLIMLLGIEAPKRVDLEANVNHTFTLAGLRQNMEDNNFEVIGGKVIDV